MSARVVIDGVALSDASAFRGIGRYLRGLLTGLADRRDIETVVLTTPGVELPAGIERRTMIRRAPGRFAALEHDLLLPLSLDRAVADVVHSPAQDPPRRCSRPWVQTLHGLAPLSDPDPRFAGERKQWSRWGPRMMKADAVIAVSAFCADQGIELLGLDRRRIHVVHHGVDDRFRRDGTPEPADPPYVLFVGEWGPSKGHADAYAVIGRLAERGLPHRLKVVGRIAPWYRESIEAEVQRSPRPDRIDLLGYVGDELPELYRRASALVITSRYESFCIPAVEAMASGTPVIAYSNTALPEIIGEAGQFATTGDPRDLADAAAVVLSNEGLSIELRGRGYERSRQFTWRSCAERHAEIFTAVAG